KQKEGIDYFDTYAPVACITTIILLLALAAIYNLVIHQIDVKTSFLNGDLDEEVYMKQPEGFVMPEVFVIKILNERYKRSVGNKMHKAFPLSGESSHWQYKFPLLVKVVPTARRLEMPLPGVCTAIEEMMKKLLVKDRWQLH
nr:zinc finger, CCHC-type [Tanacetum cinerariifolium]